LDSGTSIASATAAIISGSASRWAALSPGWTVVPWAVTGLPVFIEGGIARRGRRSARSISGRSSL
jgi:hypothetical protein